MLYPDIDRLVIFAGRYLTLLCSVEPLLAGAHVLLFHDHATLLELHDACRVVEQKRAFWVQQDAVVLQTCPARSRRRRAESFRHLRQFLLVDAVTTEPGVKAVNGGEHLEAEPGKRRRLDRATRNAAHAALCVRRVETMGDPLHVAVSHGDRVFGRRVVDLARHAATARLRFSLGNTTSTGGYGRPTRRLTG